MKFYKDDRVIDPDRIGGGRVEQGTVLNVQDGQVHVHWDGGAQTIQLAETLRKTSFPTKFIPGTPGWVGYPKNDSYTWGEFACAAFEIGGYSDMTLVDPYSGSRFWVGDVLADGPTWYEAMHRVISAAEQGNFLEQAAVDPQGHLADAVRGRDLTPQEIRRAELRARHERERDDLMRRHVEERNEFFIHYNTPVAVLGEPAEADSTEPAA